MKDCMQAAMLDYEAYMHEQEKNRRVYSLKGCSPTINGNGTHVAKVIVSR